MTESKFIDPVDEYVHIYNQVFGSVELWMSIPLMTFVCGFVAAVHMFSTILGGGIGKNGSTVAVSWFLKHFLPAIVHQRKRLWPKLLQYYRNNHHFVEISIFSVFMDIFTSVLASLYFHSVCRMQFSRLDYILFDYFYIVLVSVL